MRESPGTPDGFADLAQRVTSRDELDSACLYVSHAALHLGQLPRFQVRAGGRVDAFHKTFREQQPRVIGQRQRLFKDLFNRCGHAESLTALETDSSAS